MKYPYVRHDGGSIWQTCRIVARWKWPLLYMLLKTHRKCTHWIITAKTWSADFDLAKNVYKRVTRNSDKTFLEKSRKRIHFSKYFLLYDKWNIVSGDQNWHNSILFVDWRAKIFKKESICVKFTILSYRQLKTEKGSFTESITVFAITEKEKEEVKLDMRNLISIENRNYNCKAEDKVSLRGLFLVCWLVGVSFDSRAEKLFLQLSHEHFRFAITRFGSTIFKLPHQRLERRSLFRLRLPALQHYIVQVLQIQSNSANNFNASTVPQDSLLAWAYGSLFGSFLILLCCFKGLEMY